MAPSIMALVLRPAKRGAVEQAVEIGGALALGDRKGSGQRMNAHRAIVPPIQRRKAVAGSLGAGGSGMFGAADGRIVRVADRPAHSRMNAASSRLVALVEPT